MSGRSTNEEKTKRSRLAAGTSAASADDSAVRAEDRSVKQRRDPPAAAASAAEAASSPAPRPSLRNLAVVERQLIMQGLDINSLARLASTCRRMRVEALHKEAGKFIPRPGPHSPVAHRYWLGHDHSAHFSPLFRMHAPVCLSFDVSSRAALIVKASGFARITQLQIGVMQEWTEEEVLQLLAQSWMQRVSIVELSLPMWLRSSAIQHELFALPHLTSIGTTILAAMGQERLFESATSRATKLTSARICINADQARCLHALRALPVLTALELSPLPIAGIDCPLGQLIWCLPRTITSLTLSAFSLDTDSTPRSLLKAMFLRLPKLQTLHTEWDMEMAPLLQGMLDAGVEALPDLRRVQFDNGTNDDPDVMRRFMRRFAAVTVRFDFARDSGLDGLLASYGIARRYGRWPRVEVNPEPTDDLPSPHASDDEAESDVDAAVDPFAADHSSAAQLTASIGSTV